MMTLEEIKAARERCEKAKGGSPFRYREFQDAVIVDCLAALDHIGELEKQLASCRNAMKKLITEHTERQRERDEAFRKAADDRNAFEAENTRLREMLEKAVMVLKVAGFRYEPQADLHREAILRDYAAMKKKSEGKS